MTSFILVLKTPELSFYEPYIVFYNSLKIRISLKPIVSSNTKRIKMIDDVIPR